MIADSQENRISEIPSSGSVPRELMINFTYNSLPGRILFGIGTCQQLAQEIEQLGCSRALILSTAGHESQAKELAQQIGKLAGAIFPRAVMHTPVEVSEQAAEFARSVNADCTVALGGGSTIGLGKAIALRTNLPQIAVPTTYSGSEMTPILGETEAGQKTTKRTLAVLPETVLYDPKLTLTLPIHLSVASGINALAHAVEALYAKDRNPIITLMAEESIRAFALSLPAIVANPKNESARSDALYGAWLAGTCLGAVRMSLHHKLCHVLGGTFNLPHAQTHTVILPHAIAYNSQAELQVMDTIAKAIGTDDAAIGLYNFTGRLGATRSLQELGMPEDGIEKAALLATQNPYWNPRKLELHAIRELTRRAWAGEPPKV
jgi:maleylacetate reductase